VVEGPLRTTSDRFAFDAASAVLPSASLELSRSRVSSIFGTCVEGDRRVWRGLVDDVHHRLEQCQAFGGQPEAATDHNTVVGALVQIAGAGKRSALYCRDFKLGARRSTLQAQVDLGHPDVPVRIVPCGCDASIRYRRS
jgi:hypothetical protein